MVKYLSKNDNMPLKRYSVKENPLPRGEVKIIVEHKYGIDYIYFGRGAWRFCYTGNEVERDDFDGIIGNITHFYVYEPKEERMPPTINDIYKRLKEE